MVFVMVVKESINKGMAIIVAFLNLNLDHMLKVATKSTYAVSLSFDLGRTQPVIYTLFWQ